MFYSAGCSLLCAEGFSCGLDFLYEGLGISNFFHLLVIKTQDPNRYSA
jgi:hypothetical protein